MCHFSLHIPVTSLRSDALLDHIADYLQFISKTQLLWFTLDTSYGHGCHLASRFRLDPNDYEVLFVVAGLLLSCCASWLLHCFSPSSRCTTLPSSCCASWLLHCLSPSSHCATLSPTSCAPAYCCIASPCPLVAPRATLLSSCCLG